MHQPVPGSALPGRRWPWADAWRQHRAKAALLLLFVGLAVLHTWPLASSPSHYARTDNGDYNLNVWAIDWVARTLPTRPLQVFDAGIFHPARFALAYSEPLILQGLLAVPFVWLGLSPILTTNLVLLAGLALSGWAFALLVRHWTGSWLAGIVAGSLVAFNAHHLVRLPHLQALHLQLLPLVFLSLDRLLATGRLRHAAWFGASVAIQAMASIYLLVFTAWAALCAWLGRFPEWRVRGWRFVTACAVAASLAGALVLTPLLWPYAALARDEQMVRRLDDARRCTAGWTDYLYTGGRFHHETWSHRFRTRSADANFPGVVAMVLALAAVTAPTRGAREWMWVAVGVGAVVLSIAPRLPGFPWLHEHVPVFGAIRCYSRAGQMALVAVGVLAGFGAARAMRAMPRKTWATGLGLALIVGVNLEALRAPVGFHRFDEIPAVYDRLRDEPGGVVVEVPFHGRRAFFHNAIYMVYATRHGHPLLNGYSGFAPHDFDETAALVGGLPSFESLEFLHRRGVTHVVVHRGSIASSTLAAIERSPALRPVASDHAITIYRLVSAGAGGAPR